MSDTTELYLTGPLADSAWSYILDGIYSEAQTGGPPRDRTEDDGDDEAELLADNDRLRRLLREVTLEAKTWKMAHQERLIELMEVRRTLNTLTISFNSLVL